MRRRLTVNSSSIVALLLALCANGSLAFVAPKLPSSNNNNSIRRPPPPPSAGSSPDVASSSSSSPSSVETETDAVAVLSVSLPKPLGLILEEKVEGQPSGVFVKELAESGSALEYRDRIVGATLSRVGTTEVTTKDFDSIMELLVAAEEDNVELEFRDLRPKPVEYDVGTKVTITVQQKDGADDLVVEAAVGDNLRQVLLDHGFEVYQGLKQKLGNCGGGGQCTFCAVDFIDDSDGCWAERSEYEDQKLGAKFPAARLACLNNIQGPATIRKTER